MSEQRHDTQFHTDHQPSDRPYPVSEPEDDIVHRSTIKKERQYRWIPKPKHLQPLNILACVILLVIALYSASQLVGYFSELHASRQVSAELRELYYSQETEMASVTSTPAPTIPPTSTPTPSSTPSDSPLTAPTTTPRIALKPMSYPGNPYLLKQQRFQKLQRQNSDIIGWLTIEGLLDEAVVQRDNAYYLRRDYRGYHNDNGALFLDEGCMLSTRPYTLLIYGHNMKSGAMFGSLRNYERQYFYEHNPFITFDTLYEDGRYVIFAVGTIRLEAERLGYVNLSQLCSMSIERREAQIRVLRNQSIYFNDISVTADDQLLLLITCTEDSNERRVVAARRIRKDETEESLLRIVQRTWEKQAF